MSQNLATNQVLSIGKELDLVHLDPDFAADLVRRCPYFDSQWYQNEYPEIEYHENGNPDPAYHYANYGYKEKRLPSVLFDGNRYASFYGLYDINPLLHYIQNGSQGLYRVGERFQEILLKRRCGLDLTFSERIFLFERDYSDNNNNTLNLLSSNLATISEKLYFLRAFDHSNLATRIKLKDYASMASFLREQYGLSDKQAVDPLQIFANVDDIDFASLPEKIRIKCNGLSQRTLYIQHKSGIKKDDLKNILQGFQNEAKKSLAINLMDQHIEPKLACFDYIAEPQETIDLMAYCFNGKVKFFNVQGQNEACTFYDREFNIVPSVIIDSQGVNNIKPIELNNEAPACLAEIIEKSEKIAQSLPFIGIGFCIQKGNSQEYIVDSISFMPAEGNLRFSNDFELQLGTQLDISNISII